MPRAWIRKGFSPVPVPYRSKKPVLDAWQQLEITIETAPAYFGNPALNIGVLLGDKFGSADVDCDCPEAIAAARELLPETGLVFGRQSKPFSHYLYRSDPPVRTQKFLDPLDQATVIELRGLSSDGDVEKGFEGIAANVGAIALTSAVHKVAAVALLAPLAEEGGEASRLLGACRRACPRQMEAGRRQAAPPGTLQMPLAG